MRTGARRKHTAAFAHPAEPANMFPSVIPPPPSPSLGPPARDVTLRRTSSLPLCLAFLAAPPAGAAAVPFERLVNPEPQNWLTNHHDYAAQRYSALGAINKTNVKGLRLAFAVALGG